MARKPNYRFARLERERNKAARKAERAKLKAERAEMRRREKSGELADAEAGEAVDDAADLPGGAPTTSGEDVRTVDEDIALPER